MRAINDRVLIQETTTQEDRHIWTPDGTLASKRGVIISVGGKVEQLVVGDVILYPEVYAVKVPVGDARLHLIPEANVLVVLEEGE